VVVEQLDLPVRWERELDAVRGTFRDI